MGKQTEVREIPGFTAKDRARSEYKHLDCGDIASKSDKELAEWHSKQPKESAQFIIATNEWNRRLVMRQVRATQIAALFGAVGIIVGVILGWFLASFAPPDLPNYHRKPGSDTPADERQQNNPIAAPPIPTTP